MARAKAKRVLQKKPVASWWAVTTDTDYTQIEATSISVEDGVLTLHSGGKVMAVWNAWRKVERIDPPPSPEAEEPQADEPAIEGAEA